MMNQVSKLKDELLKQKESVNELEQIKTTLRMMNSSSAILDQILLMGKSTGGHEGLGFTRRSSGTEFFPPITIVHNIHQVDRIKNQLGSRRRICFYYKKQGHIWHECSQYMRRQRKR